MPDDFNCHFERLDDQLSVCVSPEHTFGTDAFLLADFAQIKHGETLCDLGTGCGIIPFLIYKFYHPQKIYGLDIQKQAIEQFRRGVDRASLGSVLYPIQGDLRDMKGLLPLGMMDVVTCNPPYKAWGAGILSELTAEQIARHEVLCTIDDVCAAAEKLLRFGGRFYLCQRPERLADVIAAMRAHRIEPKTLRFVAGRYEDAPWLFLMEGRRGGKPFMQVLPTLAVQDECGFSEELLSIYGHSAAWRKTEE